tara:strand:- start:35 stop:238 length:204 start_codon:yes stop_codon:yes gene_type:complete
MADKTAPKTTKAKKPSHSNSTYIATVGIEYPTASGDYVRVEAGETATGLPSDVIKDWVAQGIIQEQK